MKEELKKRIVVHILKFIPKNQKPVSYLANALNVSRESAYRRLRGDIPFTMEELIVLATNLDFSIDAIYDIEKQNQAFYDFSRAGKKDTNDFFLLMLKKYNELLGKMKAAQKIETIMAFNTFPPPFFTSHPCLFKFLYYKWLLQNNGDQRNKPYSETLIPEEAAVFQRKIRENIITGEDVTLILDTNIFLNLIKEIQYFYQRKLLSKEEIHLLKDDMLRFIETYEEIVQTGNYGSAKAQIYLSPLCVNSNMVYYAYDNSVEPLFWIFTINPVVIQNAGIISMQLKWFNNLRQQSALITQSNEIKQAEFFYQQREYLDKYLSVDDTV